MIARIRQGIAYAQGIVGLRRDDIILVSFPKSGSTWVRFFLRNYAEMAEGGGGDVGFGEVDEVMPELGVNDLRRPWAYRTVPRFVKTHLAWKPIFRGRRSVLVVRDPRDVMVSYFHYERAMTRPRFTGEFPAFVSHPKFGLEAWFRHTRSWLRANPLLVGYEELRADDVRTFETMFDALGIPYDAAMLQTAVERSRFEKVSKVEAQRGHPGADERFRPGWKFMRDGSTGTWMKLFTPEAIAYYEALKKQYPDVVQALQMDS